MFSVKLLLLLHFFLITTIQEFSYSLSSLLRTVSFWESFVTLSNPPTFKKDTQHGILMATEEIMANIIIIIIANKATGKMLIVIIMVLQSERFLLNDQKTTTITKEIDAPVRTLIHPPVDWLNVCVSVLLPSFLTHPRRKLVIRS